MAIPYPYNRLGINTGGEIIKYEPILGSQGVFVYDSRNASVTNYISSSMNFIGLDIGSGSGVDIWSRGYVKDLNFINYIFHFLLHFLLLLFHLFLCIL